MCLFVFSLRMSPPAASDVLLFDCNMRFSRYDTDSRRCPISAPKTKPLVLGSKGTEILSMPFFPRFQRKGKATYPSRLPSFPLGKAKSAIRPGGHEPPVLFAEPLEKMSGIHLSSHAVASVVFSAARGLTVVFGMGTGVSPRRINTRHSLDLIKNRILHRPLLYP